MHAQQKKPPAMGYVTATLRDPFNYPIVGAHVSAQSGKDTYNAFSDVNGDFSFTLPAGKRYILLVTHLMYQPMQRKFFLSNKEHLPFRLVMRDNVLILNQISVMPRGEKKKKVHEAGLIEVDVKHLHRLPSPAQDISQVLSLLPGVVTGPGLSNTYSVRGGTYEENLVYIEDIPIYKVHINNASEQEGLGLVNPALVQRIFFSSGAWGPDRGDKLSSVLDVSYHSPTQNGGSVQWGLLGGAAHYGIGSPTAKMTHLMALRYKDTRSLLSGSSVRGQYQPVFFDGQYYARFYPSGRDRTGHARQTLTLLANYARNRYELFPQSQRVSFGTFSQQLRFLVDLSGKVLLHHDTYQVGANFSHTFSSSVRLQTIHSYASSLERQSTDLETAYRLCDVVPAAGEGDPNACAEEVAVGRDINYARNALLGQSTFHEVNLSLLSSTDTILKFGVNAAYDEVQDRISEYQYDYAADYLTPRHAVRQENALRRLLYGGYLQYTSAAHRLFVHSKMQGGVRWGYDYRTRELWISPRLRFSFKTAEDSPMRYTLGTGLYYQPAFYRESRDTTGQLNTATKAQRSFHLLAGGRRSLRMWARDFGFSYEFYYKRLDRLIPYDRRDVFLQYYAQNISKGYAYGADFRLFGFFLPLEESWFSLGILSTAEDIQNDEVSYIRRPTDQRVSLGIFFRDYLPKLPTWKVSLRAIYGSGLPFNPPGEPAYRNTFQSGANYRLDIGFSKTLFATESAQKRGIRRYFRNLTLILEALNLLGTRQTVSYSWIQTPDQQRFAVPNTYALRFFNLKAEVVF